MKKTLALILVFIMCLAFISCENNSKNKEEQAKDERPANIPTETVEITMENWQEYFEVKERSEVEVNNLGDVEQVQVYRYIKLKDGYSDYCKESTVGFEVKETNPYLAIVSCDIDDNTFTVTKRYTDDEVVSKFGVEKAIDYFEPRVTHTTTDDYIIYKNIYETGLKLDGTFRINGDWVADETNVTLEVARFDTYEILRVKGTLTFTKEALKKINIH